MAHSPSGSPGVRPVVMAAMLSTLQTGSGNFPRNRVNIAIIIFCFVYCYSDHQECPVANCTCHCFALDASI